MKDIKSWIKKTIAFVLDLIILIISIYVLAILIYTFLRTFSLSVSGLSDNFKSILEIFGFIFQAIVILLYFWYIPKKIGNTFGRKILGISDKFNLFWTWPFMRNRYKFPAEHLKKNEILKVSPRDGYWFCPSCNERNKELQDVCSNCGQEIEK